MQTDRVKPEEDSRFRILTEISQQITSILDINELLVQVVRLIQRTFDYYHVGIGLIEGDEVVYRVGAGALWDDPDFRFKPSRLKVGEEGLTGWVAYTGKTELVQDVTRDPHYVWMQGSLTKSELMVPITVKGKTIGVLDVQSERENDFEPSDQELMQAIASQAGIAIENARLFAQTQHLLNETEQRAHELAIINSMQLGLASKLDMRGIYELAGDKLRRIFGVHGIVIYSIDHEHQLVLDEYAYEKGQRYEVQSLKMTPLHERIIRTGETIFVQENARKFFEENQHTMPAGEMPRSFIVVPFKTQDRVAGMIGLFDIDKEFAFTESDVRLLETLTSSMGVALESARLFALTQHRAEQFRVLTEVSQHIISLASVDELLTRIAQLIKNAFGYIHVGIGLVEGDQVVSKAEIGAFEEVYHVSSIPLGEGIWGKVAQEGTSVLSHQVNGEHHYRYMHEIGIHAHLCVPLRIKDKVIGVISAASDRANAFNKSDEAILQTLSNQVSVAIENARLFAETQHLLKETEQRANELTIINDAQQGLASKLDVQSIYELVGDTFHKFFNAQVVMISTYDPKSNTVEHRYSIERGQRVYSQGMHPPGGFRSQIIRTKKPILVNVNVADEATRLGQPTLPGTTTPKSWLGVPILENGEVTGILSVQNLDEDNAFDEADVRLLETFAASMSIALENARLYEQARHLAVLDERQRLARELHDSVTQSLYGISLYAQAAAGNINANQISQVAEYIEDIQNTAQESLADMRLLIYELKPPILDKEGLVAALQNRLISVEDRARIKSSLQTNLSGRLPAQVEEGIYQITREALNNIIKHAKAKNIAIRIREESASILVEISDDGVGFEPDKARREGRLGLVNMQQCAQSQGWTLNIESSPGNGTCIKVEIETI